MHFCCQNKKIAYFYHEGYQKTQNEKIFNIVDKIYNIENISELQYVYMRGSVHWYQRYQCNGNGEIYIVVKSL